MAPASAELGLPESQGILGSVYHEGQWGTDKNPVEGFKWLLRSAEQGNLKSAFNRTLLPQWLGVETD